MEETFLEVAIQLGPLLMIYFHQEFYWSITFLKFILLVGPLVRTQRPQYVARVTVSTLNYCGVCMYAPALPGNINIVGTVWHSVDSADHF